MKKKLMFASAIALTAFAFGAVVLGTVSWFQTTVVINKDKMNVTGSSAGAYFAYGNGLPEEAETSNRPYGISHPRHLYNLAWLQYTGFFADGQYYFELADSVPEEGLDMTGWILPPIGTEDNPFVGHFDGNGKIIKNLTVSNDEDILFASSNKHPDPNDVTYVTPEIVGMFGVVGNLDSAYDGTYVSATNKIENLGISDFTIQTTSNKALAGIVAGYVDATISNVAVTSGTVDIDHSGTTAVNTSKFSSNLSDYTIIGYCTDQYKANIKSASNDIYGIDVKNNEFTVAEEGETSGLGGSINMTDLYYRIKKAKGTTRTNSLIRTTTEYDTDDETLISTTSSVYGETGNGSGAYLNNSDSHMGTYNVGYYSNEAYQCLIGGYYEDADYRVEYSHTGRYITDGTNYLKFDGSSLSNTTTESEATLWTFTANSTYYNISTKYNNTTYYLYYNSGSLAIASNADTTYRRWKVVEDSTKIDIQYNSNNNYRLTYDAGWKLIDASVYPYYTMHDSQGRYLKPKNEQNGANVQVDTVPDNAHWSYNSSSKYFYYMYDSYERILGYYDSEYQVQAWTDTTSGNYYILDTGTVTGTGHLKTNNGRYVYYDGSDNNAPWGATTTVGNAGTFTVTEHAYTLVINKTTDTNKDGPDYHNETSTTNSRMRYTAANTSYFPLNVTADGTQTDLTKYYPKDTNTGYIIGGSRENEMKTAGSSYDLSDASSTRISQYAISNVSWSYSSKTVNHIYTINASNQIQEIGSGSGYYSSYQEYSKALTKMKTILDKDTSYVYGMHYVEANVSIDHKVVPDYVKINGNEYTTSDKYELPVNTIDFTLSEKGYINFFAGMYYPANDALFSLHQIRRNANNTIAEIKEIAEVLSDGDESHSYQYKFTDGKYSVPFIVLADGTKKTLTNGNYDEETSLNAASAYSGYTTVFDTSRITNYNSNGTIINSDFAWGTHEQAGSQSLADKTVKDTRNQNLTLNKSIFYFEIPMNVGEFALGATKYGYGGYLFYLDIGANARKINRTTFVERFAFSEQSVGYPLGVQYVASFTKTAGVFNVDPTDSAYVEILPSYNDELTMSRTGNTISVDGYNSTYIKGEYKKNTISLVDTETTPNAIAVVPKTVTTNVWRMQFYDYNPAKHELYRTIITQKTEVLNGGSPVTTTVVQQYNNNDVLIYDSSDPELDDTEGINIYDVSTGKNYADYTALTVPTSGADNAILIMSYTYNGVSVTIDEILNQITATMINDSNYYKAVGYVITIDVTSGSISIQTTGYTGDNASYTGMSIYVSSNTITITGIVRQAPAS